MSLQTPARLCLLAAIIAAVCVVAPAQDTRGQEPSRKQVNEGGISFVHDARDFGELRVTREEKATGNEVESSFPVDVPAHNCFQYTQEMRPNPINNEELTYNFQGLTRDGRYYVAARFAVTHPSLPKGIDFANVERDKKLLYLRRDERKLSRLPESSFRPSLKSLKALLSSVEIK